MDIFSFLKKKTKIEYESVKRLGDNTFIQQKKKDYHIETKMIYRKKGGAFIAVPFLL